MLPSISVTVAVPGQGCPSCEMLPPLVVKIIGSPYAVPALFVAYARTKYVVPAVSPVMLLVKLPVPVPSVVWLSLTVGFCEVLQHTPRAVTEDSPVAVTLPPQVAVVSVMLDIVFVVTMGVGGIVVKARRSPYAVPALFVAYART